MTKSARLGSRHALLALLFAGTALTGIAQAADTQTITGISKTYAPGVSIEIPTIEITDGDLSKETVDALVAGDTKAWGSLATLTAGGLTIPEIVVTIDPVQGAADATTATSKTPVSITFHDLSLNSVTDGVAASLVLGGVDVDQSDAPVFHFGNFSADNFNLGSYLSLYGLSDRKYPELTTLYSGLSFEGGTVTAPGVDCTVANGGTGEAQSRTIKVPYSDYLAASQDIAKASAAGGEPDAKSLTAMAHYLADAFQAMTSQPTTQYGFDCTIEPPGEPKVAISASELHADGFRPKVYPAVSISGLKISTDGEEGGQFSLDNFTWKAMDFSGPIAAVEAEETIDWAWVQANVMKLIPAMEGLSLSGLDLDAPNPEAAGERVKLSLASFDASLSHYLDGIPADLDLSFDDLKVNLPQGQADGPAPELIARGITDILLDGEAKVRWDEAAGDLVIDSIAFDSPELGHVGLSATLGNASKDLFSPDEAKVQAAAMALTLKTVSLSLEDRGIAGIIFSAGAREAGQPEPAFRAMLSGMSQGMLMAALGNSDSAMSAAQAVGQFMQGKPKLDMTITAKDPAGMPVAAFAAASENPTILAGQLTVEAEASGEPLPPPPAPATPDAPATDGGNSVDLQMAPEAPPAPTQPGAPAPQPTAPGTGAGAGGIKSGIGLTLK